MYIQQVNPNFTGKSIKINIPRAEKQNAGRELLYNEVLDVLKKNPLPAEFRTKEININISDVKYQAKALENLENSFKKLGLYFSKKEG